MATPKYEYDEFEGEEVADDGFLGQADDGLLGQMGSGQAYVEGNEDYGDEDEADEQGEDNGEEAEEAALQTLKADAAPPPMPSSFYNEFESFISRAPPEIGGQIDGAKPPKKKCSGEVVLPQLSSGPKQEKSKISASSKIKSKVTASRAMEASGLQQRPFDPALLQEAFAYADRLQQAAGEEEDVDIARRASQKSMPAKSGSAPQLSKPKNSNNGSERKLNPYERQQQMRKPPKGKSGSDKSGNPSREGVVKRLRSKTSMEAPDDKAFLNISAAGLETTRKGGLDYAALVENFENGVTLNKLKAELAASRQSMAESENFMRQMSLEYSNTKRR